MATKQTGQACEPVYAELGTKPANAPIVPPPCDDKVKYAELVISEKPSI